MKNKTKKSKIQNFVAKHARKFNKSTVFADKTKYNRKRSSLDMFI